MHRIISTIFVAACILNSVSPAWCDTKPVSRLAKAFEKLQTEVKQKDGKDKEFSEPSAEQDGASEKQSELKRATFGNGCFWCTEAVFEELRGVTRVVSGYSGGRVKNPSYQMVCTGLTGHAEVIHLEYDPDVISYATLLEVFWRTHDPTTLNRQGPDVGTQYRSVVFYHDDEQKELASHFKAELNKARAFGKPIVTQIAKFSDFYPAEKYHQDYFKDNSRAGYCQAIIKPKVKKFRRIFADQLKQNTRASSPGD